MRRQRGASVGGSVKSSGFHRMNGLGDVQGSFPLSQYLTLLYYCTEGCVAG